MLSIMEFDRLFQYYPTESGDSLIHSTLKFVSKEEAEEIKNCKKNVFLKQDNSDNENRVVVTEPPETPVVYNSNEESLRIVYVLLIIDYDLTLVDNNSQAFPSAMKFLQNINVMRVNNIIFKPLKVLWSLGSKSYIKETLPNNFPKYKFDFIKANNKHMSVRQKNLSDIRRNLIQLGYDRYLAGPSIIIDDQKQNLKSNEYDIVKDVKKYYILSNETVIDVKYDDLYKSILHDLFEFYKTTTG